MNRTHLGPWLTGWKLKWNYCKIRFSRSGVKFFELKIWLSPRKRIFQKTHFSFSGAQVGSIHEKNDKKARDTDEDGSFFVHIWIQQKGPNPTWSGSAALIPSNNDRKHYLNKKNGLNVLHDIIEKQYLCKQFYKHACFIKANTIYRVV